MDKKISAATMPVRHTAGYCLDSFNALPPKHRSFVEEYALYPNGTKAYMKAYPESSHDSATANAARLLKSEKVQAALAEIQELNRERYDIQKDFIVARLLELIEDGSHATQLKALDLLSKVLGMSSQKISVDGVEPVSIIMTLPGTTKPPAGLPHPRDGEGN